MANPSSKYIEELDATSAALDGLEDQTKTLNARDYTIKQIDSLVYSEQDLTNLRSAERNEYLRKTFMQSYSVSVVFELAEKVVPFVREA